MLKDAQTAVKFFSKFLKGAFRQKTKDFFAYFVGCASAFF